MSSSTLPENASHEAPLTLDEPAPKVLSFWDQSAFWANLGVSLFAFTGAYTVLAPNEDGLPQLSIAAGIVATIVGTLVGGLMLGLSALVGSRTGQPSMVVLRGLFGAKLSYVPTVLNIAQLVGWGTFELIVIAEAAKELFGGGPRFVYVVAAGLLTTVLTIWPLGSVRMLRRFVTAGVVIALGWFYIQFIAEGLPSLTENPGPSGGGPFDADWSLFWIATDAALAVSISWVPVAADYTRHSRSDGAAFTAAGFAYGLTQIIAYVLGLFALVLTASGAAGVYSPFLTVTLGGVFFFVFVLREADQSFANVYSTAVSIQNLAPRVDRRILSVALGALITVLALVLTLDDYFGFLSLIGSVFVPMLGVLAADFFLRAKGQWNTAQDAPSRWGMIVAWLVGFVVYQLINPGDAGPWTRFWVDVQEAVGFTKQAWMSASLLSCLAAALAAFVIGRVSAMRKSA
ncbi:putative hydroxymethylpyrimidine transporter CytX [Actinocorallia lasiicapitis]